MAFKNQTNTWGNINWVCFNKGPRIYYAYFSLSMDGTSIKYGCTIYKNQGEKDIRMENHFHTAKERFERFPVVAQVSEKIIQEMETPKTRRAKMTFFESKIFQNFLIQNFVKHGVRCREGKESYSSLRKKILDNRQAIINKKKKTLINKTNAEIKRAEKQRKMMIQGFKPEKKGFEKIDYQPENIPQINSKLTYNMVIWQQGNRIYHVDIQHDPNTGKARYGACVFRSSSLEECQNYDREIHIDTAVDRFENFPILATLPINYQGQNKRKMAKGEFPLNRENIQIIKKAMCMFGSRQRNVKDNLLKKKELIQNQSSNIKKLNRLQQVLDYDLSCYHKNSYKQLALNDERETSKIIFMDTPPILLSKNKKIPTPPNSPKIQMLEDEIDRQQNGKQKKTTKGYKEKTKNIQKRIAAQNYTQDKISKERKNAEKTKEKINRRKTFVI